MKKLFSIIMIASVLFLSNCGKNWLDVNKDPNNPETATAELVFPAGVISVASQVGGYYALVGGFWSQYFAQSNAANQYKELDQYNPTSTDFNSQWREMYAGALSDLQYVIDDAEANENWTYFLLGTVMQAYGFTVMVDFYDNVPYFEAFQGASDFNFSPVYDNGDVIYADLIKRIDIALKKERNILTEGQVKGDILFGIPKVYGDYDAYVADNNGDIQYEIWSQFANTLKLKMYLRMAYADPGVAQAGISKMYTDGDVFLGQDAFLDIFVNATGQRNPLYESNVQLLNVGTNLRTSTTIFNYFDANSDPRMTSVVGSGTNPMPQGGFNIASTDLDPTTVCVYQQSPTDPVYFISEVESYLLQAEAVARGWGIGDDQALYNSAVTADFSRKGYSVAGFIGVGDVYEYPASGTLEEKIEAITMAKWAAFAGTSQTLEAFFETNRNGYPQVGTESAWDDAAADYNGSYVPGFLMYSMEGTTAGKFPKRMLYPQDEINLNTNVPAQTSITDKVWWDKK